MKQYEVGIGWVNPADQEFAKLLRARLKKEQLSFLEITYQNLEESFAQVRENKLGFRVFVDRSLEDNPAYAMISFALKERGTKVVNDPVAVVPFGSKAILHRLFVEHGFPVLKTYVLSVSKPAAKEYKDIVKELGIPFVLKPAHGGGGDFVSLNARSEKDIKNAVADNHPDFTLVQEYVSPMLLGKRTAWFRPIFACGKTIPLWWDPQNHFYREFGNTKEEKRITRDLIAYTEKLHKLTGIDLFSTEVILDSKGKYRFIDYLNHPIDLNSQDITPDALPPSVLLRIIDALVAEAQKTI